MHPAPCRVGLLGFGYASQTFHAPLIRATPGLQLVAVGSSDHAKVRLALGDRIAVHASAQALIADTGLDLVVVATPNDTHHALARAALLAGRHVVVDKPFTLDASEAAELGVLAGERQRVLSVFHNRRWDGDFLAAGRLLASGRLGKLRHAALHFDRFRPRVRERWREAAAPGGGLWMDLAPHLLDQALQWFGPPAALMADIAALRDGARADDHFAATLRYADGLRVQIGATTLAAAPRPRFALHGTRGSFVKWGLDGQEEALKAGRRPGDGVGWGIDPQAGTLTLGEGGGERLVAEPVPNERGDYPAYYRQLRDAIGGLAPNPVPPHEALQVMRLLDLGTRSARQQRWLDVTA